MRSAAISLSVLCGLVFSIAGCSGNRNFLSSTPESRPDSAGDSFDQPLQAPRNARYLSSEQTNQLALTPSNLVPRPRQGDLPAKVETQRTIQPVSHAPEVLQPLQQRDATLTIEGRTYRLQLVEEAKNSFHETSMRTAASSDIPAFNYVTPTLIPLKPAEPNSETDWTENRFGKSSLSPEASVRSEPPERVVARHTQTGFDRRTELEPEPLPPHALRLNLPTALSMIGGQHPAVGFAQWRVQEAYAQLHRAQVLWLPSIQPGFSFHRHDGNFQASDGSILDVNRNSFQYGLGTGATGAGTTPIPGIVAQFHLADAIFQPEIAQKTAWARGHAANGVVNEQLLNVAVAYLELLDAEQDLIILKESRQRTGDLAKLTGDFAAAGQGLQADADRLQTELRLVENRLAAARERVEVASARLAQTLSIDAGQRIVPLDPTVVPIELVSLEMDKGVLISTGLSNRPELKEAQALVAAACEQYQRQKYAPFVPSVLLGLSTGGFGGGLGNSLNNVDSRYDFDALLSWEIRNLGFGEGAVRRESEALIQQAKYEKIRVLDQVAREVAEAHAQVLHRAERIAITQHAIQSAEDSYTRNLNRIRDGQGLPLEVLQSVQALEDARRAYLRAVVEYNEAQFRLQWALGWPLITVPTPQP